MELNEIVRGWLENAGISQGECAERAGINLNTLERIVAYTNPTTRPHLDAVVRIARVCGVQLGGGFDEWSVPPSRSPVPEPKKPKPRKK